MEAKSANIIKEEVKAYLNDFFKDYPIFLVKFTGNEEWAKDILEGKLYMNTFKYYRDLEKETGIKGQGDILEGIVKLIPESIELISNSNSEKLKIEPNYMNIKYNDDDNILLYCMRSLKISDFDILEFEKKENKLEVLMKLNFNSKKIEQMKKDFGEYVVVINQIEMIEKVNNTAIKEGLPLEYGDVIYSDDNDIDRIKAFSEFLPRRFLYKDAYFEYQQEYRIVIQKENTNDKFFNIGRLEEALIIKTEDLKEQSLKIELII